MSSILENIFAAKREELERRRAEVTDSMIQERACSAPPPRDFVSTLHRKRPAIIAEIKRASPSKGDIFSDLDPTSIARQYQQSGAAAISVLTDRHFKGTLDDLIAVRGSVELPVLRKDFIFDEYQVYEARAAGADCILLVVAMLSEAELRPLMRLACKLGMSALVEVHDEAEFTIAAKAEARLIGINNRNLHNFVTDIAVTEKLVRNYEGHAVIVSESGIETAADIERLSRAGAGAFLVGESLLRDRRPGEKLRELTGAKNR